MNESVITKSGELKRPRGSMKGCPCSVPGCGNAHEASGYCRPHYLAWYHGRDPLTYKPRPTHGMSDLDRFLFYVDKESSPHGCWLWTGAIKDNQYGYGAFVLAGHRIGAHQAAWRLFRGPIPPKISVLHNCPGGDNAACVNPCHLWLGTNLDNMKDMARKGRGRGPRGSDQPTAKLTWDQVRNIRERFARGGISQQALAGEYGVGQACVSDIILQRTWKD